MDPEAALTELLDLSTQIVEVVITGSAGAVEASRTPGKQRSAELAAAGAELLAAAAPLRSGGVVERVHVDLERGSIVAVSDAERSIVATTVAEPTRGLVAYDLRATLRRLSGDVP